MANFSQFLGKTYQRGRMFDEIFLRANFGCKLLPGHFVVGRFGFDRIQSLVAISQTLDKLVVHDLLPTDGPTTSSKLTAVINEDERYQVDEVKASGDEGYNNLSDLLGDNLPTFPTTKPPNCYIAVKEVIKSVSVKRCNKALFTPESVTNKTLEEHDNRENMADELKDEGMFLSYNRTRNSDTITRDLIIIGCSNSVIVYDSTNKNNLININTSSSINSITNDSMIKTEHQLDRLTICGGSQKIYALKLEYGLSGNSFNVEISSERSTGDTVTCLIQGKLNCQDLVITGSTEHKVRVYQLDSFDQNIQPCCLTLEETGRINCLCPILTQTTDKQQDNQNISLESRYLPSIIEQEHSSAQQLDEQMSYFSCGIESASIAVYRMISQSKITSNIEKQIISAERLWRQRCKYTPICMLMYDINGDGYDELIVGFKNGRIEARSPFTGQLLSTTRCFTKSDRLSGLAVIDYYLDGKATVLLACSTNGLVVGFKPKTTRPRIPLKGYSLPTKQNFDSDSRDEDWLNSLSVNSEITILKTIEDEENRSGNNNQIFMREETSNLHIGYQLNDQTKINICEAKQSFDLLQKVNILQMEQMDLERRACRIYHMNMHQSSKFFPSDVNIDHKWDFDLESVCLRLTIVVRTNVEDVELMKLEDESRNMLNGGFLLVNPQDSCEQSKEEQRFGRSYVMAISLRSSRDIETTLSLKVFCAVKLKDKAESTNFSTKLARVYNKQIIVPKFAMFTFSEAKNSLIARPNHSKQPSLVKLDFLLEDEYQVTQILDWLSEKFLCLQFDNLIRDRSSLQAESPSNPLLPSDDSITNHHPYFMVDESKNFELNLIDLRHTLKKIATDLNSNDLTMIQNSSVNKSLILDDQKESIGTMFGKLSSILRIVHSNGLLTLECENSDLVVDLVQSLMIDRLHFELTSNKLREGEFMANVEPILADLETVTKDLRRLEESEKRIQTELYESADYARSLMQQLAIANELNEFTIAKELLNELFIMLNEAQNAARTHCLNNKRAELTKEASLLREKISFLTGQLNDRK